MLIQIIDSQLGKSSRPKPQSIFVYIKLRMVPLVHNPLGRITDSQEKKHTGNFLLKTGKILAPHNRCCGDNSPGTKHLLQGGAAPSHEIRWIDNRRQILAVLKELSEAVDRPECLVAAQRILEGKPWRK